MLLSRHSRSFPSTRHKSGPQKFRRRRSDQRIFVRKPQQQLGVSFAGRIWIEESVPTRACTRCLRAFAAPRWVPTTTVAPPPWQTTRKQSDGSDWHAIGDLGTFPPRQDRQAQSDVRVRTPVHHQIAASCALHAEHMPRDARPVQTFKFRFVTLFFHNI
jgi:hypothetical protein